VPIAPLSPRPLPGAAPRASAPMSAMPPGGATAFTAMGGMGAGQGPQQGGAMDAPGPSMSGAPAGAAPRQAFVPLGQVARIETVMGAPMIKSENGSLTGWVYVDVETSDIGGWVHAARDAVAKEVKLPPGYLLKWTGQYELLERVRERMAWILPLTLAIVFVILYLNFKGAPQALIVMTSVPFAAVGAVWTLWAAGFNTSIAVWVGMIALLGVAAETASVMVVYLEDAWRKGGITSTDQLADAALEAAGKRVRPLLMTVMTNVFGLLPILLDDGVGSDVAKRIAAPMWGGLVSLTLLTLIVIPAVYVAWRGFSLRRLEA
jgi:copper/silver efflux system protein